MFSKTRVAVLRGGPSSEYYVSLRTGATVLENMPDEYHPVDVFIDRDGRWHVHGRREEPHKILGRVDVVWNALHGEYGEDGQLQALLEAHGVPFSGPRRLGAALALQKHLAKQILAKEGIHTPYFTLVRRDDTLNLEEAAGKLYRTFPQPAFIKPAAGGSSLGVSLTRTPEEIAYALSLALELGDTALVEEYIEGQELVCGVVENYRHEKLYSLFPVHAVPTEGSRFLEHHGRLDGNVLYRSPVGVAPTTRSELARVAAHAHRALGLRHYSSSDFILHPRRGLFFIETDALPSLAPEAAFSAALKEVGATMPQFLDHVLTLTLQK